MIKIMKNILPYWRSALLIIILLFIQAFCDLSLPQYTSDIIDTGIINNGIESVLPIRITAEDFSTSQLFMTEEEQALWEACYRQGEDGIYHRISRKDIPDKTEDALLTPLLITYQLSTLPEDQLAALKNGAASPETAAAIRDNVQTAMDTMGASLMKSMGIAYAKACDEAAGVDLDALQFSYLLKASLKMVGMALIIVIDSVIIGLLASRVGASVGRDLREKQFSRVISFSNQEMDQFSSASLITRCTNDVQQIQFVSVILLRMLAYAPILGIGGVIKVIGTGSGMGWIIALALIVILGFVMLLVSVTMPKFKIMQKLVDQVNLISREILTGLSVIRAFGRESHEEQRFDEANTRLTKTNLFTNRVMSCMMPGMTLIMNGLSVLIVWVAAHRIDTGVMQVGTMTAFITYAMMIIMSFLMMTMMSIMLPRAGVAAQRIDEVLSTDSSILDPDTPQIRTEKKGVLAFSHVGFRYPGADTNALTDISFTACPGQTTAIIGSTGSGKSALIQLIPRLYDVTEGQITLDGVDIRQLPLKELRKAVGMVPQKAVLFSGTIASNICYSDPDLPASAMKEAAQIAQASDFIEEKKEAYNSPIAQGGSNVSGGQKQRLSIARAIASDPEIFVFDDSFSALDLKTDAALRAALRDKTSRCTVLIVAQRISTILYADQILVLDEGQIVGKGTHRELMESCEVYRQIARSQLSESEIGGAYEQ